MKPSSLTDEERAIVERQPADGAALRCSPSFPTSRRQRRSSGPTTSDPTAPDIETG